MSFKIIESKLQGKCEDLALCEDRIVINDNFVCVIDGATSKTTLKFKGETPARVAGVLLEKELQNMDSMICVTDFIELVNKVFCQYYKDCDMYDHMKDNAIDRLSASVAVISIQRKELWLIGDCQAMIDDKFISNDKLIDSVLSNLRSFIIYDLLNSGESEDSLREYDKSREAILPFLKKQFVFQNNSINSDFSYEVLDGFADPAKVKIIDICDSTTVILASDGYPKLFNNLKCSEDYLNYIIAADPLCYKLFKSTKGVKKDNISYDDRSYVKLSFE